MFPCIYEVFDLLADLHKQILNHIFKALILHTIVEISLRNCGLMKHWLI